MLADCDASLFGDCLSLRSLCTHSTPLNVQRLIHMTSAFPYRQHTVQYSSTVAVQILARAKWRLKRAKMENLFAW